MAEETNAAQPAKKASKTKRPAKKAAAKKGAVKPPKRDEALPSERPVASAPQKKTSQYVVTVDNQTGVPVKVEKLDEATGRRQELSAEEYWQAMAYRGFSALPMGAAAWGGKPESQTDAEALVQAYYRGIVDYINALTSNK